MIAKILAFFLGMGKARSGAGFSNEIRNALADFSVNTVKPMLNHFALLMLFVFTVVMSVGVVGADLIITYREAGSLAWTPVSVVGLCVLAVAGIALIAKISFGSPSERAYRRIKREVHTTSDHPIGDAVSLLILDFVEERRVARRQRGMDAERRAQHEADLLRNQKSAFEERTERMAEEYRTPGSFH